MNARCFIGPRVFLAPLIAIGIIAGLGGCGYHTAGHADLVPKSIHSVCVDRFSNATTRYKLSDRIPDAVAKEFIARTSYHIVSNCAEADAILRGSINNFAYNPVAIDPTTGAATVVDVHVFISATLTERATNKTLLQRSNIDYRDRYEISADPETYFNESDAALNRVARFIAQQLVSDILNAF